MTIQVNNNYGLIEIDEQVIASVAGMSAMECYGIVGMASKSASEGFFQLLNVEQLSRGIRVNTNEENEVSIDLHIFLQYGVKISVVADNIISKVKYSIETLIGMKVQDVKVFVEGVRVQN